MPPFLSFASFFFLSPLLEQSPASLFHPLRSVTNTQSRRCPYRKSPAHRRETRSTRYVVSSCSYTCVYVFYCVGDPSESRIECQRTNRKSAQCTYTFKTSLKLRYTYENLTTPFSTRNEFRSNAWNFHRQVNYTIL